MQNIQDRRKKHWVDITVTFSPSPRADERHHVQVTWSHNNDQWNRAVGKSPWYAGFEAADGDTVGVTARQSVSGVMGCRIKVDGKEQDHDMLSRDMVTCVAVI